MTDCRCMAPPFDFADFDSEPLGIDQTNGRFAEVSVETCRACGAKWLRYFVEFEAFTASGRWYRGLVTAERLRTLTPELAVTLLESLPWYFYGGSYFQTTGRRGSGRVFFDL